jgi:hypothetical protein
VRVSGSPPLTFYYQISLLLANEATLRSATTLSFHKTHNYFDAETPEGAHPVHDLKDTPTTWGGQSSIVRPYPVPVDVDSHIWYSAKWPITSEVEMPPPGAASAQTLHDARALISRSPHTLPPTYTALARMRVRGMVAQLVSVQFHAHQSTHQQSFLFAARPSDLGLGSGDHSIQTLVGRDNAEVRATTLALAAPLNALVCSALGGLEWFDSSSSLLNTTSAGACLDRASYPVCVRKTWEQDEIYTVLSLNGPTAACGVAGLPHEGTYTGPPGTSPQHSVFFLTHRATGEQAGKSVYSTYFNRQISELGNMTWSVLDRAPLGQLRAQSDLSPKSSLHLARERMQRGIATLVQVRPAGVSTDDDGQAASRIVHAGLLLSGIAAAVAGLSALRRSVKRQQYETLGTAKWAGPPRTQTLVV